MATLPDTVMRTARTHGDPRPAPGDPGPDGHADRAVDRARRRLRPARCRELPLLARARSRSSPGTLRWGSAWPSCASAGLRLAPAVFLGAVVAEAWLRNPDVPWTLHVPCALALTCVLVAVAAVAAPPRLSAHPARRGGHARLLRHRRGGDVRQRRSRTWATDVAARRGRRGRPGRRRAAQVAGRRARAWPSWCPCSSPCSRRASAPSRRGAPRSGRSVALFAVSLAVVLGVAFGGPAERGERMFYLLFLPLIVVAVRRGVAGASDRARRGAGGRRRRTVARRAHAGGRRPTTRSSCSRSPRRR